VDTGVLIPPGARACREHFSGNILKAEDIGSAKAYASDTTVESSYVDSLLKGLRSCACSRGLDFDTPGILTPQDYWNLTGLSLEHFNILHGIIHHKIHNSQNRSTRTAQAILLMKLRTGLSYTTLATLFALSKDVIKWSVHCIRRAIMSEFVPRYLGLDHMSREEVIQRHTRPFAKELFSAGEDSVILVADGTYVYIQKSSNYSFQRRTYSLHKGRPLVKPMMLVTTTGYILDVTGPFLADGRNNDASIFKSMLTSNSDAFRNWLHEEDILVVDRGFRDCLALLEEMNLIAKMPHFLGAGRAQHTAEEANQSRLVTSVRWVVESANGLLKTWKALAGTIPNSQVPYIGDYVRIISALCNAFRPPRVQISDEENVLAQRMLSLSKHPNMLKMRAENEGWSRKRVDWIRIAAVDLHDFPRLTYAELCDLTMGIYQLKQARSYTAEHTHDGGTYDFFIHRQSPTLLRVQIQSRHTQSRLYNLWLEYSSTAVLQWYCQCKVGARVVGCCAHVAAVIWYLSYAQYTSYSSPRDIAEYIEDAADGAAGNWSSDDDGDGN